MILRPSITALALAAVSIGCQSSSGTPAPGDDSFASATIVQPAIGSIPNLHEFAGIYTAGQPQPADFAALRAVGVKTVVNYRHTSEQPDFNEAALARELQLTYLHLPWSGPEELTDEVFASGRDVFESAARPVLVHCGSANRVGALWVAWRALDGGLDIEAAVTEAREIGLRTPAYEALARDYVERQR